MNNFILVLVSSTLNVNFMKSKITGFLVVFISFGLIFTSGLSVYLTESLNNGDTMTDKTIDDTPKKDKSDPDGDNKKDNEDNEIITATITINPYVLNCKSKGKWITVYIELPAKYNVEDIDLSTVVFNNQILSEEKPTAINNFNNNNLLDLMVKFDRSSVISLLESQELCEVIVSGKLNNKNKNEFKGSCEIAYR